MSDSSSDAPGEVPGLAALKTFGRYDLLEKLGEGGMGVVYRATLRSIGGFSKVVALKFFRVPPMPGSSAIQAFLSEARLGGFLHHPNIVQTLDVGEHEGRLFMAMEYVHGPSLERILEWHRRRRLLIPPDIALQIMVQVCHGLNHAHAAKDHGGRALRLVHRDLKPMNILVENSGLVKVADFGVARAESNLMRTLHSGLIKGTVPYMSPEQSAGRRDIDHRSDLFSAGLVLFELLTLEGFYEAEDSGQLLLKVMKADTLPRLGQFRRAPWHPGFYSVLERMLARDRKQRYQSGDEMAAALEELLALLPSRFSLSAWMAEMESATDRARNATIEARAIPDATAACRLPPDPGREVEGAISGRAEDCSSDRKEAVPSAPGERWSPVPCDSGETTSRDIATNQALHHGVAWWLVCSSDPAAGVPIAKPEDRVFSRPVTPVEERTARQPTGPASSSLAPVSGEMAFPEFVPSDAEEGTSGTLDSPTEKTGTGTGIDDARTTNVRPVHRYVVMVAAVFCMAILGYLSLMGVSRRATTELDTSSLVEEKTDFIGTREEGEHSGDGQVSAVSGQEEVVPGDGIRGPDGAQDGGGGGTPSNLSPARNEGVSPSGPLPAAEPLPADKKNALTKRNTNPPAPDPGRIPPPGPGMGSQESQPSTALSNLEDTSNSRTVTDGAPDIPMSAVPEATGRLSLNTDPSVAAYTIAYLDGQTIKIPTLTGIPVSEGEHIVVFEFKGGKRLETRVTVRAGQRLACAALPGSASIACR